MRPKTRIFAIFSCSLVFLKIAYSDSLQQCLTSSRGEIHEKSFWGPTLGQNGQNGSRNWVFVYFLQFGSLVFLEIASSDSLQQYIASNRSKAHKNIFGDQIWAKTDQNRTQNYVFVYCFFFKKNEYNNSLQQCSRSSRGKTHKIFFQEPNLGQNRRKTGPKLVFCHSLKFGSLVFLQIAQDESFEDCITTRRGKTRQKKFESPHFG